MGKIVAHEQVIHRLSCHKRSSGGSGSHGQAGDEILVQRLQPQNGRQRRNDSEKRKMDAEQPEIAFLRKILRQRPQQRE